MTAPASSRTPGNLLWSLIVLALGGRRPDAALTASGGPIPPWLHRVRIGDPAAQQEYVGRYWSTVEKEAGRYAARGGPMDDLRGEAALALWEAAFSYDPKRHRTALDRYVENRIHQRVRRAYVDAMGYQKDTQVVPLTETLTDARNGHETAYSTIEWLYDLDRATRELAPDDMRLLQAVIDEAKVGAHAASELPNARFRKRLQRARRRLREKLAERA